MNEKLKSLILIDNCSECIQVKFAQFVMFYACALDPENCGVRFARMLADFFVCSTFSTPMPLNSTSTGLSQFGSYVNGYFNMCEVPLPWKSAKLLQEWIGCFFDMPTAVVRNDILCYNLHGHFISPQGLEEENSENF
ncbi:hypothetical protein CK203_043150 [Vitis vinifera]|uniref:Uncharacterized protein n=1 Tax=Vitis vinifera TaxID=29760 RepID=A0A438H2T6_VITVI|nr:hypothetical protein CK203_043150 [Vitis vinifera]